MEKPPDNSTLEDIHQLGLSAPQETGSVRVLDPVSSSLPGRFDPGWSFHASFITLCIVTLAVALDATSLSVALPVTAPSFNI